MRVKELLEAAHYLVDGTGKRTAVQLELEIWEQIMALLHKQLDEGAPDSENDRDDWNAFMQVLTDSVVDTGISDLAQEHDHYLYGTPKRGKE